MTVSVGDWVTRNMTGVRMPLKVTAVTSDRIGCGPWEFDRRTGAEIDEELGWGTVVTGSFLEEVVRGQ